MSTYVDYYKVILNGKQPQIRRFSSVTDDPNGYQEFCKSFENFCEQIEKLFPELKRREYRVTWKDFEDDFNLVSSDAEFNIAKMESGVQHPKGHNVYTFYVTLVESSYRQNIQRDKSIHPHIICDGCEKQEIEGFRYKCLECRDYDLCQDCEAQGMHPAHCMLRIPALQSFDNISQIMKNFFKRKMYRTDMRKCPMAENFVHLQHEKPNVQPNRYPRQEQYKQKTQDTFTSRNNIPTAAEVRPALAEKFLDAVHDILKGIGITIEGADPSGFEVYMGRKDDQNSGQQHSASETPKTKEDSAMSSPKPDDTSTKLTDQENLKDETSNKENDIASSQNETQESSPKPSTSSNGKSAVTDNQLPSKPTVEADEWLFVTKLDSSDGTASSPPSTSKEAASKQNVPSAPIDITAPRTLYPQLPQVDVVYHPDPVIQRAVDTMMSMGFTNEHGWLTQLLLSEKGNIGKALDVLQPMHH